MGNSTSELIETVDSVDLKLTFPINPVPSLNPTVELVVLTVVEAFQLMLPALMKFELLNSRLPPVRTISLLFVTEVPPPKTAVPEVDFAIVPVLVMLKVEFVFPLLNN